VTERKSKGSELAEKPRRRPGFIRRSFRVLRKLFLLAVLATLSVAIYLNQIGLPESLQKRLKEAVLAKGWQIDFTALRLHSWRELAIEGFHLKRTNELFGPEVYVSEAYCRFRPGALRRLNFDLEALRLTDGYLFLPVGQTNQTKRAAFRNVTGELLVKSDDQWELRNFQARFLGANVQFMGVLTNSSLLRDWRLKRDGDRKGPGKAFWANVLRALEPIHFQGTPQLIGQFYGDAADPRGMEASIRFAAPGVSTPWGSGSELRMLARLSPPTREDDIVLMELTISAENPKSALGEASYVHIHAQMEPSYPQLSTTNASFAVELRKANTKWAKADLAELKIRLTASPTNAELLQTDIGLRATAAESRGWRGDTLDLNGRLIAPQPKELRVGDTNLLWPDRLANVSMSATGKVGRVQSTSLQVDGTSLQFRWDYPLLHFETTSAIADGALNVVADARSDTREVSFWSTSSLDPRTVVPLLSEKTQRWLSHYSWERPPRVAASGTLRLPDFTNTGPAWLDQLLPTISLEGQFKVASAGYRGVRVSGAESPFGLTNLVWNMPRLRLQRPEGMVEAQYSADLRKAEFYWRVIGPVDPRLIEPFLETDQQRKILSELELKAIPRVDAEVRGTWRDLSRLGASGLVIANNLAFRGQHVDSAETRFVFTNQHLSLLEPRIKRPGEEGFAPGIHVDFQKFKLFITNAFGNLDPHAVVRTIGRQATKAIAPYTFDTPPTTRVSGTVDFRKKSYEDELHFEISGRRFHWEHFTFVQLSGRIDWVGQLVTLSQLNGSLATGRATGEVRLDFAPKTGADFSFKVIATDTDLSEVLSGFGRTNKVEGTLNGEMIVTRANTETTNSWQGHGRLNVRDGLLWNLPMFGLFSPVLNAFMPGLGNSRAREATATFNITNSVVYSKDLEVHATAMRMQFQGKTDFNGNVEARVEAELLRDLPGIGLVLSKVLWPVTKVFEYKVTGTLSHPKSEPVYVIPKLLMLPFQPFKTLKELIEEQPANEAPKPQG